MASDIEKKIKSIHSQYPWVSESTLSAILSDSGDAVKIIMDLVKEVDESEEKFEDARKITDKQNKTINGLSSAVQKFKDYTKDYSGPGNDAEKVFDTAIKNINDFGGAAFTGARNLGNLAPATNTYTKMFKGVIDGSDVALGAFTTVMSMYGKLALEQEKSLRVMIDYGIVSGDTKLYTTMRDNFASVGMSINEGMEKFQQAMPLFANAQGTMIENINTFALMTSRLKSDKSVPDMGESYEGIMSGLVDHANRLHGLGRFQSLDTITQKRLVERFQSSTSVAGALAETLGDKRSDQEARKREASEDIDFRRAMLVRGSFILEQYGEQAYDNIIDSTEEIVSLSERIFGKEISGQIGDLIARSVNDIHRGGDVSNNLTEEMNTMLNLLGPHVKSSFIHMMNNATRGNFSRIDAADAFRLFVKEVESAPDLNLQGMNNPIVTQTKLFKDMAEIAPKNFIDISSEEFRTLGNTVAVFSEQSDDAIDAVDMMRATLNQIANSFQPGFNTMGDALALFDFVYSPIGDLIGAVVEALTPDAGDKEPADLGSAPIVPSRPRRFLDMNGFLPTSPNHPMNRWDKAYGSTHNPDGSVRSGGGDGRNPTSRQIDVKNLPPLGDLEGGGGINMANMSGTRNQGLQESLINILQTASYEIGANVTVTSGGQMSLAEAQSLGAVKGRDGVWRTPDGKGVRVGSTRHDAGGAADLQLTDASDGHTLDMTNDHDMARIYKFLKTAKGLGAGGIGAGDMHKDGVNAYMGSQTFHVGFGPDGAWGDDGAGENAPKWLTDMYDTRSGEFIQTGSLDSSDPSLRVNQDNVAPSSQSDTVIDGALEGVPAGFVPMNYNGYTIYVAADYAKDSQGQYRQFSGSTAQDFAQQNNSVLPTRELAEQISRDADVQLSFSAQNNSNGGDSAVMTRAIEEQKRGLSIDSDDIISGHMKDVVQSTREGRTALVGGRWADGRQVQPFSTVHSDDYSDYSQGVRLVYGKAVDANGNVVDISRAYDNLPPLPAPPPKVEETTEQVKPEETTERVSSVDPDSRRTTRASESSSRPKDVMSHGRIPQSYETNALDAMSDDNHLKFLSMSSERRQKIISELEDLIYDSDGNYIGDTLSQPERTKVVSLIDRLEGEEQLTAQLSNADQYKLPSAYVGEELDKSVQFLAIMDDILADFNTQEVKERSVE